MHKYPIQNSLRTRCPPGIGRPTPSGLGSAQVNTIRRKTYKQYQPEDITAALYLVATSQASIIQAAKQFNIPTRTLYQRIYNIKKLYALGREPDPRGVGRGTPNPTPEPNPEEIWSTPENELPTSGRDAEGVQLCDSEGLKNLMLTSLHASSLRVPSVPSVPSTLMSQ